MPRPEKFIDIGRVGYAVSGPERGKLCAIVDIIDQNRALVDGPLTGVKRQEYQLNRLQITKLKIKIHHGQRSKYVEQAWKDGKIDLKWSQCALFQKLHNKKLRNNLTDFDKFKVGYLKQVRSRLVKETSEELKKKKVCVKLSAAEKQYYVKKAAIKEAIRAAKIKEHGSEEKYKLFLKNEVPKLKKEFKTKARENKTAEIKELKATLDKCGHNRALRIKAFESYALNKNGRVRFTSEGKVVMKKDLLDKYDNLSSSQIRENNKLKAKYLKNKETRLREELRLKKKVKRKRMVAAKRKPWAKKRTA